MVAMIGGAGADTPAGRRYNVIEKDVVNTVLIGQDILFNPDVTWTPVPPVIVRYVFGDFADTYDSTEKEGNYYVFNVNWWPALGAFYVNGGPKGSTPEAQAQLSVEYPKMPLKLKVKGREVSAIAMSTPLNIDVGGINLDDKDVVDLVILGPNGQIAEKNGQLFKDITVAALKKFNNGGAINTTGWDVGRYTFQVKTKPEKACNLKDQSVKKELTVLKGEVQIKADRTEVPELTVVQLGVSGIAGHKINVREDTLSRNAYFPAGLDDNPMDETTNNFTDVIDDGCWRTYAVVFNDTGVYTIKVTDYDETDSYDTVDITVTAKDVIFDVPSTVVLGDLFAIKGTANTGDTVTIAVKDEVVQKLYQTVIDENGEFREAIDTSSADAPSAFKSPGSVRLKAYIDYSTTDSLPKTIESSIKYDGSVAILMTRGYLKAELSTQNIAEGDDFTITGTATGSQFVDMLIVSPNGYNGSNIEGGKLMYYATTSVTAVDVTFYKKIRVGENVDTGRYLVMVLNPGSDGVWGQYGYTRLYNPEDPSDPDTSLGHYTLTTRTQEEMLGLVEDETSLSDDLLWIARVDVQMPYVSLNPISGVGIGEPLEVSGTTNREEGYTIVITVKGPVELVPATVKPENGTFNATIDTTDAKAGSYIVKADDGDGNTDETLVDIGVAKAIFDTGTGTYPSIAGTHNGTITTNVPIQVSKLYTYPCAGTGGHTEHVIIRNESGIIAEADWGGYQVDGHNNTFDGSFTLAANETYSYTIRTGSYPQIIHADSKTVAGGTITCDTFVDTNGNTYTDWIPAIRFGV